MYQIVLFFFFLQLGEFIDADLKSGLIKSLDNRHKNITEKDDWDRVQETVSACVMGMTKVHYMN